MMFLFFPIWFTPKQSSFIKNSRLFEIESFLIVKLINPGPAISIFSTNEGIFLVLIILFDISLGFNFNFLELLNDTLD